MSTEYDKCMAQIAQLQAAAREFNRIYAMTCNTIYSASHTHTITAEEYDNLIAAKNRACKGM